MVFIRANQTGPMLYFEDFAVGDSRTLGSHTFTESEIIEFATEYDPQRFHVDPKAAAESIYGGLIASGWHTGSVCMRLLVEDLLADVASMGARGVDEFRWHRPVRPGDTLTAHGEVVDMRASESDPRRGYVDYKCTMENQDGDVVLSMIGLLLFERRDADEQL